jgi:hypothetical protein
MNVNFEVEAMKGDTVSYCRRQKFKDDVIDSLETVANKI